MDDGLTEHLLKAHQSIEKQKDLLYRVQQSVA